MTQPSNDAFLRHEATDRLFLLAETLSQHVLDHPFVQTHPEILTPAKAAMASLMQAYQAAGAAEAD
jgi:hypothetical protein